MVNTTKNTLAKDGRITDTQIDEIAKNAGEWINESKKIHLLLPLVDGEDSAVECCINGYNLILQRGVSLEVPEPVVELLRQAGIA